MVQKLEYVPKNLGAPTHLDLAGVAGDNMLRPADLSLVYERANLGIEILDYDRRATMPIPLYTVSNWLHGGVTTVTRQGGDEQLLRP